MDAEIDGVALVVCCLCHWAASRGGKRRTTHGKAEGAAARLRTDLACSASLLLRIWPRPAEAAAGDSAPKHMLSIPQIPVPELRLLLDSLPSPRSSVTLQPDLCYTSWRGHLKPLLQPLQQSLSPPPIPTRPWRLSLPPLAAQLCELPMRLLLPVCPRSSATSATAQRARKRSKRPTFYPHPARPRPSSMARS